MFNSGHPQASSPLLHHRPEPPLQFGVGAGAVGGALSGAAFGIAFGIAVASPAGTSDTDLTGRIGLAVMAGLVAAGIAAAVGVVLGMIGGALLAVVAVRRPRHLPLIAVGVLALVVLLPTLLVTATTDDPVGALGASLVAVGVPFVFAALALAVVARLVVRRVQRA